MSFRKWTNKKVAIIGSGPAGIACADVLTRSGVKSHVFDKNCLLYTSPSPRDV